MDVRNRLHTYEGLKSVLIFVVDFLVLFFAPTTWKSRKGSVKQPPEHVSNTCEGGGRIIFKFPAVFNKFVVR